MMKPFSLHLLLALAAAAMPLGVAVPLTLDPELYSDALREVQAGARVPAAAPAETPEDTPETTAHAGSSSPGVEDWQAAMRDAGTELADVRLLVLLQRLNPLDPPSARAEDYAAVLRLHHLMLAGNARACLLLARACREGCFESGLLFIQSESLARLMEQRAASFHLPSPAPLVPEDASS